MLIFLFLLAAKAHANVCAQAPDLLDEIIKRGEIRVGWVSARPFQYIDENGELMGAFVNAGNMLARTHLNVDITWVEARWDTFIAGLQTGKFDIVISNVSRRPSRSLSVWFTKPIALGSQALLVRKGADLNNLADIDKAGNTIVVRMGSAAHITYADKSSPYFKNARVRPIVPPVHPEQEVASGRAVAMGAPVSELVQIVRANPDWATIMQIPNTRFSGGMGFVVPQCQYNLLHFTNMFVDTLIETRFMSAQAELFPDIIADQYVAPVKSIGDVMSAKK